MDISTITQAARMMTDAQGTPVVVLPLSLWQELLKQIDAQPPQNERIKAILKRWESEPEEATPEWWDALDADLKANRITFPERDLDLDEG